MVSDRDRPAYLPTQLADEVRRWAPPELSDDEVYRLQRLAERIHADGYDSGHMAGYQEGWDASKRPNSNDVNRLREALAAEAEESKDA